jgi:putative nucleotidyltransferase with HDIG domain
MITGVAQRATAAIENQQLIGRIQNQLHKSARLYEISTRLHVARQLEPLLRNVIEDITRVFAAPAAEILLFDEKGTLGLRVATGLSDAVLQGTIPRPSGSAHTVWRTGQPLIVNDASLAPAMIHPRLRQSGIRALLGLPLRGRERIWGVVRVLFDRPQQLLWDEVDTLATYVNQVAVAIENTRLYQDLEDLLLETIRALVHAFEAKDYYSAQHSEEVMRYAVALARELGLSEAQCRAIQFGALLHDIGKIGIGDQILLKGTVLDTGEWHLMRTHPVIGAEIVKDIGPLRDVIAMIRHHHERFDGLGYPDGLAGEEIPLEARILSVVDAFESMISDRAYREALSVVEALKRLEAGADRQWDGHIAGVWCTMVRREGQELLGVKWDQLVKEKPQHKPRSSHANSPSPVERASLAHLPGEEVGPLPDVVLHRWGSALSEEKTKARR